MKKSDIKVSPDYFQMYLDLAPEGDLIEALTEGGIKVFTNNLTKLQKLGDKTYAEGKWTVNQMIEHCIDTERIFQERSLRFARNDRTKLPGFDENAYADSARSNDWTLNRLLKQYIAVRGSTLALFSNFNEEELQRTGVASGKEISVLAMGYIIIGHPIHHFNVLVERYFPLID